MKQFTWRKKKLQKPSDVDDEREVTIWRKKEKNAVEITQITMWFNTIWQKNRMLESIWINDLTIWRPLRDWMRKITWNRRKRKGTFAWVGKTKITWNRRKRKEIFERRTFRGHLQLASIIAVWNGWRRYKKCCLHSGCPMISRF